MRMRFSLCTHPVVHIWPFIITLTYVNNCMLQLQYISTSFQKTTKYSYFPLPTRAFPSKAVNLIIDFLLEQMAESCHRRHIPLIFKHAPFFKYGLNVELFVPVVRKARKAGIVGSIIIKLLLLL